MITPFTYHLSSHLSQCTDKKVSRNHAEIEVTKSGEVFLTSVSHWFGIYLCDGGMIYSGDSFFAYYVITR